MWEQLYVLKRKNRMCTVQELKKLIIDENVEKFSFGYKVIEDSENKCVINLERFSVKLCIIKQNDIIRITGVGYIDNNEFNLNQVIEIGLNTDVYGFTFNDSYLRNETYIEKEITRDILSKVDETCFRYFICYNSEIANYILEIFSNTK